MKTPLLCFLPVLLLIACGGSVAGTPSSFGTGPDQPGGDPSGPFPGPPTPPAPGGNGSRPAIIVDATAKKGDFTALFLSEGDVYVAEVVRDSVGHVGPADGTTIWHAPPVGEMVPVVSTADIGIPFALGVAPALTPETPPQIFWIDGFQAFGALKTPASASSVTTLTTDMAGTEIAFAGTSLYADYDKTGLHCIASVGVGAGGSTPTCTSAAYGSPLQGGSGFRIVNGTLYATDTWSLESVDLASGTVTHTSLPDAIVKSSLPGDSNGAVFDVAVDSEGSVYLATRVGVWKKDASGGFRNVHGKGLVQQVEVVGKRALSLDLDSSVGLVSWVPDDPTSDAIISNAPLINTRFVATPTLVYWIEASGHSVLHTAY